MRARAARPTGLQGLLRLFLCVTITASALCSVSCGSTKTAARAELKRQMTTDVGTGVSLELTGLGTPAPESAELCVPLEWLASLPEGAGYNCQEGSTAVSVSRGKGDSLRIRATGMRNPAPDIRVRAGTDVTLSDSTAGRAGASPAPQPRGQPAGGCSWTQLVPVLTILFALIVLAYIMIINNKQQSK